MSITNTYFASRNHLPPEILAEIADHMASDYILDSSDRYKNLGSCCLVSRTFRHAFRPQQFRRISIHDPLPSDAPRYKPSMRAFAALLQQDPSISTYVRKLCLTMDFGLVPTSQKVEYAPSAEALLHGPSVLSSLSHVEEFTWETSFPGLEVPFQAIIEPMKQALLHVLRLPTLRKLECFNIDGISIEDIPRNITSLALRDAALSRSPSPEESPAGSPDSSRSSSRSSSTGPNEASVTQIQNLRLSNIDSYWAKQLSDAMDYHPAAFSAVRDLNLVNVEVGVVRRALLCAGESLKKLQVSFLPLSETDLGRYFGYLDLSSNTSLESLTLSFGCWLTPPALDRLLSSLSKSLRSLAHSNLSTLRVEIQAQYREGVIPLLSPTRWTGVNSALADDEEDPDRFACLRQVTLCVSNYEYPTFSLTKKNYEGVDQAVEEARRCLLPALEKPRFSLETNFVDPLLW